MPSPEYMRAACHPPEQPAPAPDSPAPRHSKTKPYPTHPEFAGLHRDEYQQAYGKWFRSQPGYKAKHTQYTRDWRWARKVQAEAV